MLTPAVITWDDFVSQIIDLSQTPELRERLKEYCNSPIFTSLREHLGTYHALPDLQRQGEEGFKLLSTIHNDLEVTENVTLTFIQELFNSPLTLLMYNTIFQGEKSIVQRNILALGIQHPDVEDVFHLVNISPTFTGYDMGNIEAWIIAQSRKPNPSTIRLWIDQNNYLVYDLYVEIYKTATRQAIEKWRNLHPERIADLERFKTIEEQIVQIHQAYLQNPTLALLLQHATLLEEHMQLEIETRAYIEAFKADIASEGILLQDNAYHFIKDQPREQWDRLRLQFMAEQLNVPRELLENYAQKTTLYHERLDMIRSEFTGKYPNFSLNDVQDAFGAVPELDRYYNRELLLRMDYRCAHNLLSLMVLKLQGGNIIETGTLPEFNQSIMNIIELHVLREVPVPGQEEPRIINICKDHRLVLGAIKERTVELKIHQSTQTPDLCYNNSSVEDQVIIDSIWSAIEGVPIEGFFKTIERNSIFKDYVKLTDGAYLPQQYYTSRQVVSSRSDSAGLQAIIEHVIETNTKIEFILPALSIHRTIESLRAYRDTTFFTTFYHYLDAESTNLKNMTIEAQCQYRLGRFMNNSDNNNDDLCGPTAIRLTLYDFFASRYNRSTASFLESVQIQELFPDYALYLANRYPTVSIQNAIELINSSAYDYLYSEAENVLFRRIQRVLKFQEYFETKALHFYQLANNLESKTLQFIPQDLLLSSFEYPEGLCLGLSILQGLTDDLNANDIFAADIAAVSALQQNRLDNTLSVADTQLYKQFSEQLRNLNRSVNAVFFDEKETLFKNAGTASVDQLATAITKLPFQKDSRFLLVTPNHGMTLSLKGDTYTFYDSNIGFVSFESLEKTGLFIQQHLDLITGLGDYYELTHNDVYITSYQNADLTIFKELSYFTDIIKQGGVSLTIDILKDLDHKHGFVKFKDISFKRTELAAMGCQYNLNPVDEKTPFEDSDFWDKVSFNAQKLYRFIYNHEIDTVTIDRLKTLEANGKLPTDGGVLLAAYLTDGKATGHTEPLHYDILRSAEQIADAFDRFSIKLDNLLDNLGLNLENYKFKNSNIKKLDDHFYQTTLVHKKTEKEVSLSLDCTEFERIVNNHVNTLAEATEPAVVLGGVGLGLMGLIRGATALRGGHGSSYDIVSVALGGKQLADAILGTVAMTIIEDSLAESGTIFTFSIEGTIANLCERTALQVGGIVGKLLTSISIFLKLPLIGLNIWGLYEDVTYLNSSEGSQRAVAISQLVIDSIVAALTLASFAVPEVAVPVLIISALGLGIDALVQNLANAHERYYQFIKWQDNMRAFANLKSNKPAPGVIDLSRNQILGNIKLTLTDNEKKPYQLSYTKSCDNAFHYGHHPDKTPEQVRKEVDYGYPSTSPIPPFAREEFINPDNLPFSIGSGIIQLVILGFGTRFQLMSQVEYISDWLLYDDRNKRQSSGYWETFYTAPEYNSIQQDGLSCEVTGNNGDNIFMIPNIIDWSDPEKASETIERFASYQFTIDTGLGNNTVTFGQTGTYELIGGTGNNILDLSQLQLNFKVDLDITNYQDIYDGGRYATAIKASITNFNTVKCPAFNFNLHREATIRGGSNKPNNFIVGKNSQVTIYGRGGGNTYIVSEIPLRKLEYAQEIKLYLQPPVTANDDHSNITVERIHFEDYKLLYFSNVTFLLDTKLTPVLSLEGIILQSIYIEGFTLVDNAITNVLFSTKDGFSFYYDDNLKKGVVTQVDFDKWNLYNEEMFKQTFDFHFFSTIYKEKFVLADDVVCINKAGTLFMNQSNKKGILFANLKTEIITIPKEFKEFSWTVATNHAIHTISIQNFMCNTEKPMIVFDGHSLINIKNTIDLSDFGKTYTLVVSKQRNALLVTLINTDPNEQLIIFFKDIFNQNITQAIANSDIVLRRDTNNVLKISALLELCKNYIHETLTIPFVV